MSEVADPSRGRARWGGAVVLGLLIGTVIAIGVRLPGWWQSASGSAGSSGTEVSAKAQRLGKLIDAERVRAGCPILRPNAVLEAIARNRSQSITGDSAGAIGHVDSDLRDPQDRASAAGYRDRVVENLAVGLPTADEVMAAWLNPRIDRALQARLDDCTLVSVGIGHSTRRLTSRFGAGVWVVVLGAG